MKVYPATDAALTWQGRRIQDDKGQVWLFGSAASVKFRFKGDHCRIWMQNQAPGDDYNYISLVIDGEHTQRIKINYDTLTPLQVVPQIKQEDHEVELYKDTEAKSGAIIISNIEAAELTPINKTYVKNIEFIGNSISAGMSSDLSQVPCDKGTWYDQHNAYAAFGPAAARKLNCDYLVAAVSGLGMYRNWNSDHPTMRDVYGSAILSPDPSTPRWNFDQFKPDIVVSCVGSNDLSDGDGVTPRLPFDSTLFINSYIDFLKNIYEHHPQARFLLLNGPVNPKEKDDMFKSCLQSIKRHAEKEIPGMQPVELFYFDLIVPAGCGGHPDVKQQAEMARALEPVLKKMISK